MSVSSTPSPRVRPMPAHLVPPLERLSARARAKVPQMEGGTSTSKHLAAAFSAAVLERDLGPTAAELTTTVAVRDRAVDLPAWAAAFPQVPVLAHDAEVDPAGVDVVVAAACFARFGLTLAQALAWYEAVGSLNASFGHPFTLDEVVGVAAVSTALGMDAELYHASWRRLSSLSRHERVLSRPKTVEVVAMARALEGSAAASAQDVVAWVLDDWQPAAAARIVAAGGDLERTKELYARGVTSSGDIVAALLAERAA